MVENIWKNVYNVHLVGVLKKWLTYGFFQCNLDWLIIGYFKDYVWDTQVM